MKTFKQSVLGVAVAIATGFATTGSYASNVVIDLFNDPVAPLFDEVEDLTGAGSANEFGSYASVLGGYRDMYVKKTQGDPGAGAKVLVSNGSLKISNEDGVKSTAAVTWDGMDSDGDIAAVDYSDLLVNATGLDGFSATVRSVDLGFNYQINVWDTLGNTSSLTSAVQFRVVDPIANPGAVALCNLDPFCAVGPVTAFYDFDWFNFANGSHNAGGLDFSITRTGTVDFSKIGAIQFVVLDTGDVAVDLTLDSAMVVPEPNALTLVGLGLVGAAVASRRRKSSLKA